MMENPSTSDARLVAAALSGSLSAFEALVVRHQGSLYLHALSYMRVQEEAQDVLQDAFLRAYNHLHELREPSRFSAWLGQIVRNIALNRLRANRRTQVMARSTTEEADFLVYQEQTVFASSALRKLLARLPQKGAEAVRLYYLENHSIQEVAQRVGTKPSVVKQRLYRARQQLQEEVTRMTKDDRSRHDLPEGFEAQTIARLIEQGRESRLYLKIDEARTRFREVLEISPDHPTALVELGSTYDPVSGPSSEEVATIEKARRIAPDSIAVARALTAAWVHDKEKQSEAIDNCVQLCERRLKDQFNDIEALTAMAQMYLWKRDFKGMEETASQAVSVAPDDQQCVNYLALSLARQGKWDEAYPLYKKMYRIDDSTIWAYVALRQMATCSAFHRGDWKAAVEAQEKVWNLTDMPNEASNLIYFYSQAGMKDKAKALYTEVRNHPHPQRVYDAVGA